MESPVERYAKLTLSEIVQMVKAGASENLNLEFKSLEDETFAKNDRKYLAEAVSGFANSDGGVVVWGVDARRDSTGIDCAVGEKRIQNLAKALSAANEHLANATSPSMTSARNVAVIDEDEGGFLLTVVPSSDEGPFMAKLGVDRYMVRSSTSFLKMEHFQVADMFGRRQRPSLDLRLDCVHYDAVGNAARFVLSIENAGRGIARFAQCRVHIEEPYQSVFQSLRDPNGLGMMKPRPRALYSKQRVFTAEPHCVVHAGDILPLLQMEADFAIPRHQRMARLEVEYELRAEGMPPVARIREWRDEDLRCLLRVKYDADR